MKRLDSMIGTVSMFLLIIALLAGSFWMAAYGDSEYDFYEREYEKYQVTEDLGMQLEDVMSVTEYMMDYLIGREEVLSIETDVDGQQQDFFNEQDRLHMGDVRNLFIGGIRLGIGCLVVSILLIALLIWKKADWKHIIPKAYFRGLAVFGGILVFLAIAFSVNFTACFTIFHEMFFTNDLWLFDPATDYMIRMLPEGFFSDMVIRIGCTYVGALVIVAMVMAIWKKKVKTNKKYL